MVVWYAPTRRLHALHILTRHFPLHNGRCAKNPAQPPRAEVVERSHVGKYVMMLLPVAFPTRKRIVTYIAETSVEASNCQTRGYDEGAHVRILQERLDSVDYN